MKKLILAFALLFITLPALAAQEVILTEPKAAFGELIVTGQTPVVQLYFPYNTISNKAWKTTLTGSGTATATNSMATMSTTAATNSGATIRSRIPVKYNAGQGAAAEFTAIFTQCKAGSTQEVGISDEQDGYTMGCNGAEFGSFHRHPAYARAANTSITSVATTATVTTTSPHGLTSGDYVQITGVTTTEPEYIGTFKVTVTGASTFTYTLPASATSPATGATKWDKITVDFKPISASSEFDPTATTENFTGIDITKGNVFKTQFQYLGFGEIDRFVENKKTGRLTLFDRIKYANSNLVPSLGNPTLPLTVSAQNTTNNTNIITKSASLAGFVQGVNAEIGPEFTLNASKASITTEQAILTIRNKCQFNGEPNKVRLKLTNLNIFSDGSGNNPVTFNITRGLSDSAVTLGGSPSFTDKSTTESVASYDTAGTTVSGGETNIRSFTAGRLAVIPPYHETDLNLYIEPCETLTFSAVTPATAFTGYISTSWKELR